MKRILATLLCLIMIFALVACGGTEGGSDTSVNTGSDGTEVSSDSSAESSSSDGGETEKDVLLYDPDMEHKFIATDITNHSIVVFDLNACDGDFTKLTDDSVSVVWEWDPEEDPTCKGNPGAGIDSAKYRYSAYYERDVIIACSSGGWAGVIDYEEKKVLWEYEIGNGPHSIEMLPNGDVVVACSSDPGALVYVPLSAGVTRPSSSIPSLYCHGVSWDPENEWLWVLEDTGVYAATITDMGTAEGKISRIGGVGDTFGGGEAGGHAFSPVYGEPGKYWASSGQYLWQFDTETEELTRSYNRYGALTHSNNIKGIASFPDGTVVETVAGLCGNDTKGWSSDGFRIIVRKTSEGKVQVVRDIVTVVQFDVTHREFYKVQPFTKDYQ